MCSNPWVWCQWFWREIDSCYLHLHRVVSLYHTSFYIKGMVWCHCPSASEAEIVTALNWSVYKRREPARQQGWTGFLRLSTCPARDPHWGDLKGPRSNFEQKSNRMCLQTGETTWGPLAPYSWVHNSTEKRGNNSYCLILLFKRCCLMLV